MESEEECTYYEDEESECEHIQVYKFGGKWKCLECEKILIPHWEEWDLEK